MCTRMCLSGALSVVRVTLDALLWWPALGHGSGVGWILESAVQSTWYGEVKHIVHPPSRTPSPPTRIAQAYIWFFMQSSSRPSLPSRLHGPALLPSCTCACRPRLHSRVPYAS